MIYIYTTHLSNFVKGDLITMIYILLENVSSPITKIVYQYLHIILLKQKCLRLFFKFKLLKDMAEEISVITLDFDLKNYIGYDFYIF